MMPFIVILGGILLIDHRNYDEILKTGLVPMKNIYYNVSFVHLTLMYVCDILLE